MTYTVPKITSQAQRDRLQRDLERMLDSLDALASSGPGPRGRPEFHAAIVKSGQANARDLAAAITKFDRANRPKKRTRRQKG